MKPKLIKVRKNYGLKIGKATVEYWKGKYQIVIFPLFFPQDLYWEPYVGDKKPKFRNLALLNVLVPFWTIFLCVVFIFVGITYIPGRFFVYLSKIIRAVGFFLMGETTGAKKELKNFFEIWI